MTHIIHKDLSCAVRGVLFNVHNALGMMLPEKFYQAAITIGLEAKGIRYEREKSFEVYYHDARVGLYLWICGSKTVRCCSRHGFVNDMPPARSPEIAWTETWLPGELQRYNLVHRSCVYSLIRFFPNSLLSVCGVEPMRRFITLIVAAGLLLAIHAFPAAAVPLTRYVALGGDCGTTTPCYATLQSAIDAAQDRQQRMGKGTNQFGCEGSGLA
jgi:hypothetical protein